MTTALKLDIKFNDNSFPPHVLELLSQSAADIVLGYFSNKVLISEGIDPKFPYIYPESELRSKTIDFIETALARHRATPYPDDDVQIVLKMIDKFADQTLTSDFGPTATQHLHPRLAFTQG